jgi:hypothetical protein
MGLGRVELPTSRLSGRARALASRYPGAPDSILSESRRTIGRRKIAPKANRDLSVHAETLTGDDLLDIYDFILNVEYVFDEFFIDDS